MNHYAYVHNDPINATDPSGKVTKLLKTACVIPHRQYKNEYSIQKKRQFGAFLLSTLILRMSTLRDRSSNHH